MIKGVARHVTEEAEYVVYVRRPRCREGLYGVEFLCSSRGMTCEFVDYDEEDDPVSSSTRRQYRMR